MKCPNDDCDFECETGTEMLEHIPLHEKTVTSMREYGYHVEVYTNRHGKWQITVGVKDDDMVNVVTKTIVLYNLMKKKAEEEGFEVV